MGMVSKGFGNVPLKDLTTERKRVEEFEESSAIHVSQLHSLVDCLPLGGGRRGFTPRVSVSSLIIHRVLSLCLHLSTFKSFPFNFCCECDFN